MGSFHPRRYLLCFPAGSAWILCCLTGAPGVPPTSAVLFMLLWAALASLLPVLGMGEVLLAWLLHLDGVGVCWKKPVWFRLSNESIKCPAGHKPGPKFFMSCLPGGC